MLAVASFAPSGVVISRRMSTAGDMDCLRAFRQKMIRNLRCDVTFSALTGEIQRCLPMKSANQVYVSITGLRVKSRWHELRFWYHAITSMAQAKRSDGIVAADARTINGIHHTLTVWESETAMRRFLYRGAHRRAIKAFPNFASGKTFGYVTEQPPDWDQVHKIWLEYGKAY